MSDMCNIPHYRATVGKTIRSFREEQELTQTQLAGIAGISRTRLNRIESGQGTASLDAIVQIAEGLGIAPFELLLDVAAPTQRDSSPSPLTLCVL